MDKNDLEEIKRTVRSSKLHVKDETKLLRIELSIRHRRRLNADTIDPGQARTTLPVLRASNCRQHACMIVNLAVAATAIQKVVFIINLNNGSSLDTLQSLYFISLLKSQTVDFQALFSSDQ